MLEHSARGDELAVDVRTGTQAIVPDANEAFGEHVQEEASKKLDCVERQEFLLAAIGVVLDAKCDFAIGKVHNAVVGNGNAVGVVSEVLEDVLWTSEGWLGIDDPVFLVETRLKAAPSPGIG